MNIMYVGNDRPQIGGAAYLDQLLLAFAQARLPVACSRR